MNNLKICFISSSLGHQQVSNIFWGLTNLSQHRGFKLEPYFHDGVEAREQALCNKILSQNYDFIISLFPINEENYSILPQKSILFIGNKEEYNGNNIILDIHGGLESILDYYLQNQIFNIAFIGVKAGCPHCVKDHFIKHYINRLNITEERYFLTTCFGEVTRTIESLREQEVEAIIFSSPRLLLHSLKHEENSELNLSNDFKVASLGWMREFDLFKGEIIGFEFIKSEIINSIEKFINGNFNPEIDGKISGKLMKNEQWTMDNEQ